MSDICTEFEVQTEADLLSLRELKAAYEAAEQAIADDPSTF